jgi:hypothetical protein
MVAGGKDVPGGPRAAAFEGPPREHILRPHSSLKLAFLEHEGDQEALRLSFGSNSVPALEGDFDSVDLLQNVCAARFSSIVVVGNLALLIHLNEGLGDDVDMLQNSQRVTL